MFILNYFISHYPFVTFFGMNVIADVLTFKLLNIFISESILMDGDVPLMLIPVIINFGIISEFLMF